MKILTYKSEDGRKFKVFSFREADLDADGDADRLEIYDEDDIAYDLVKKKKSTLIVISEGKKLEITLV